MGKRKTMWYSDIWTFRCLKLFSHTSNIIFRYDFCTNAVCCKTFSFRAKVTWYLDLNYRFCLDRNDQLPESEEEIIAEDTEEEFFSLSNPSSSTISGSSSTAAAGGLLNGNSKWKFVSLSKVIHGYILSASQIIQSQWCFISVTFIMLLQDVLLS